MPYEVTDFWTWTWLRAWAPTFWYGTALVTLWLGSGVFVFRSLLRTWHSRGWLRVASDQPRETHHGLDDGSDRVIWTFSSMRVLIVAAILGPAGSSLFAFGYVARRALARWKAERAAKMRRKAGNEAARRNAESAENAPG